jgi:hypothetical protein
MLDVCYRYCTAPIAGLEDHLPVVVYEGDLLSHLIDSQVIITLGAIDSDVITSSRNIVGHGVIDLTSIHRYGIVSCENQIHQFFLNKKIGSLLKRSNIDKERGISPVSVFRVLVTLVFTGKNLFRTLEAYHLHAQGH